MTITEESRSESPPAPAGIWHRRQFHAPPQAVWVPVSLEKLVGQPAMPALRDLQAEAVGGWSVEEFISPARLPLAAYLTKSAAPVWVFVSIVQRTLAGLIALHENGFYHGALSPRTVLVDPAGDVVLAGCGAGVKPPAWSEAEAVSKEAPTLRHSLAAADLKDLGRVFRAVLGGDPGTKVAMSRPDIAPLVAEWIDWLADPPEGREAASALQAESVFNDIRTGRTGWRPWQSRAELPPEIGSLDTWPAPPVPADDRARLKRAARRMDGFGFEWRGPIVFGLIALSVVAGGAWMLNHFLNSQARSTSAQEEAALAGLEGNPVPPLPDEDPGSYLATGGDIEPVPDTEAAIAELLKVIRNIRGIYPAWDTQLQLQGEERERTVKGELPTPASYPQWLSHALIFPPMGKSSQGRIPGDYYLVWRTQNMILTIEESRTLQSAILRSARFCGVRVMAWTVLPNQAAVVLRVPPRQPLTDERLERRIAILRGEKMASAVMAKVNAKLKAGDHESAEKERRPWRGNMGSVAGFYGVVKTLPIVAPDVLGKMSLWQEAPVHLSALDPDTSDLLRAAAIVDTAAVTGGLVESASAWPSCSLTAATLNYGPALRAISVLMQDNPQAALPLPAKKELHDALRAYRHFLGDLPPGIPAAAPEHGAPPATPAAAPPQPAGPAALPVSSVKN